MDTRDILKAIEDIKNVKAKYFRFVDTKNFDGFRKIFTSDAKLEFPEAQEGILGIDEAIEFIEQAVESSVSVHFGHMPEIEIIDQENAKAIWPMDDRIYWPPEKASILGYSQLRGFGHYHETYQCIDGIWKIKTLRLTRLRLVTQHAIREIA